MQFSKIIAPVALALATAAAGAASAQPSAGPVPPGRSVSLSGRVTALASTSFTLNNRITVYVNNASIRPAGLHLKSGSLVYVQGTETSQGGVNAKIVNIRGWRYVNGQYVFE